MRNNNFSYSSIFLVKNSLFRSNKRQCSVYTCRSLSLIIRYSEIENSLYKRMNVILKSFLHKH